MVGTIVKLVVTLTAGDGVMGYPVVRDREVVVDGTTYTLRFFQAADAKMNSETLGHGGQSSRAPCYWCVSAYPLCPLPLLSFKQLSCAFIGADCSLATQQQRQQQLTGCTRALWIKPAC